MTDAPEKIWVARHEHGSIEAVDYGVSGTVKYIRADIAKEWHEAAKSLMTDCEDAYARIEQLEAERDAALGRRWDDAAKVAVLADQVRHLKAERDAAYKRGLEDAAKIAKRYRLRAGGGVFYNQACAHIEATIRSTIKQIERDIRAQTQERDK